MEKNGNRLLDMRKYIKIISIICLLFTIFEMIKTCVFANEFLDPDLEVKGKYANERIDKVENSVGKIWGSVATILQVVSVFAIIFTGVRYLYASADLKSKIKNEMAGIIVGALLVFASSSIIKFIKKSTDEVLGQ